MDLQKIVRRLFSENGAIDKPSFVDRELVYQDGSFFLVALPQQLRTMRLRTPRITNKVFAGGAILSEVEGYFVGGMRRQDCTCGKEPIFVEENERSREPGREQYTLLSELGLSRSMTGLMRFQESGYCITSDINLDFSCQETPFFKNRTYELWTVASSERAREYRGAFERVSAVRSGAKFYELPVPEGVFCILTASYVMLRPGQERAVAQKLILETFS